MVSNAVNDEDCRPNPSTQFSSDPPIIDGSIPSTGPVRDLSSGSLEGIGGHTITANLSKAAAELYSKAWRPGTRASYKSAWKRWSTWYNNLCSVVECLRKYLELTEKIRDTNDRLNRNWLLLSFVKPHHPVTTSTLARWLKSVISSAGIDTANHKTHSTRSACTSKAFRAGDSSSETMKQARWSNLTTFSRFYCKPLAGSDFQKAVLIR
ncbi:unnamed protein product [Mytilus edulis]|uniref:Uncharacterized protein n=1 Tax=Mytilus edulis TaxID=6550 RepID=A0A8S3SVV3_MYTED|nr:unnamed protein product [Mytilus edulis]